MVIYDYVNLLRYDRIPTENILTFNQSKRFWIFSRNNLIIELYYNEYRNFHRDGYAII